MNPADRMMEFAARFDWLKLTEQEKCEAIILWRGGVTVEDAEWAIDRLNLSMRVRDDWPWLRTVMITRAAERLALKMQLRREMRKQGEAS